jgi:hypothetical protein
MGVAGIGESKMQDKIMYFDRILAVANAVMPLITVIVTGLVVPGLLEWWKIRKVHCSHRALFAYFDKICRSFGPKTYPTVREERFENDADLERLIASAKDTDAQSWQETNCWQFKTALNIARIKAGLESGNFFHSRHFLNKKHGEQLAILTVQDNTAKIHTFCKDPWELPKSKNKPALHSIKVKLLGYDRPDYSVMLV